MQPDRILTHVRKLPGKHAVRVTVYVVGIDDSETEDIGSWSLSDYEGDQLKDLATELGQAAQFDVDERGGSRKYRGVAYTDDDQVAYKWQMRMQAERQDDDGDARRDPAPTLELDEPTAQGLLAQAMRHQERQFSVCMSSQERIIRSMQDQLVARDKRIEALERDQLAVIETLRALRLNNLEGVGSERTADRIDKTLQLLTEKFLPAAGIQLGFLPEGFDPQKSVEHLTQKLLSPPADDAGTNGKAERDGDGSVEPPAADAGAADGPA